MLCDGCVPNTFGMSQKSTKDHVLKYIFSLHSNLKHTAFIFYWHKKQPLKIGSRLFCIACLYFVYYSKHAAVKNKTIKKLKRLLLLQVILCDFKTSLLAKCITVLGSKDYSGLLLGKIIFLLALIKTSWV